MHCAVNILQRAALNTFCAKSRGARLAVPYRRESREGQLVEGDCVGGRNRWGVGGSRKGGG